MANPSSSLKTQVPFELVYQVAALVVAIILVHLVYITVIRPNADAILQAQAERAAQGEEYVQDRSLYVVLKDFEQEKRALTEKTALLCRRVRSCQSEIEAALAECPDDREVLQYTGRLLAEIEEGAKRRLAGEHTNAALRLVAGAYDGEGGYEFVGLGPKE